MDRDSYLAGVAELYSGEVIGQGLAYRDVVFGAVAFTLDDARVGMVEKPVQQRGGQCRVVVEDFRPIFERTILIRMAPRS